MPTWWWTPRSSRLEGSRRPWPASWARRGGSSSAWSPSASSGAPPQEADLVLDVRPLPNPHYDPALRPRTGLDPEVRRYVFSEAAEPYYRALLAVAGLAAEGARAEGRAFYTVAVGCTGGRHRSVAVAERLAEELSGRFAVEVVHRDVEREG